MHGLFIGKYALSVQALLLMANCKCTKALIFYNANPIFLVEVCGNCVKVLMYLVYMPLSLEPLKHLFIMILYLHKGA